MVRAVPCKQALMSATVKASEIPLRTVRLWLLTAAAMIFLTLVVGGATRLTESGLSIVEWKPVTGVLPPLSESDWQTEFTKYQAIPQYREINRGMGASGIDGQLDLCTLRQGSWWHGLRYLPYMAIVFTVLRMPRI